VKSLRGYLVAMATLLVLLLCASTALVLAQMDASSRTQSEHQLLDTGRAMSLAIDGRMRSYEAQLLALRESEALQREDWAAFDAQARKLQSGNEAWIVLSNPAGAQLVNTMLAPGAALPHGPAPQEAWRAAAQGRTHYCNLSQGFIAPHVLCVDVPVMRDGRAIYLLSVVFQPHLFDQVFASNRIRPGRLVTVLDRNGVIIWRSLALERYLGRRATASALQELARRPEGTRRGVSLEGQLTVIAFSRSQTSGWTSIVAVPRGEVGLLGGTALGYGLVLAAIFLVVGVGVGLAAGRRVANAIGHLSLAAARLRRNQTLAYQRSGLAEVDAVGAALEDAVRERDASQERFRLAQEVGGIGAWEWDLVTGRGYVSDSFKEMHGLGGVVGALHIEQLMAVIHPDDLAGFDERRIAALRGAGPATNEYRVIRPDGLIRWIHARGQPLSPAQGAGRTAVGVVIDLTERRQTEERLQLLMREVDHRANNLMAVVQGAVKLSRGRDMKELREIIVGRVQALARAHQLLSASRWRGADLRRLMEEELRPYTLGDEARVTCRGPSVPPLSPAAAQGLAMALHELATNAAKHGALSVVGGSIAIAWDVAGERLRIRWTETGGPPANPPAKAGFGMTVLQRALSGAIRGGVKLDWRIEGLVCDLEMPAPVAAE
jgi:PAS domain S-box-containing protein